MSMLATPKVMIFFKPLPGGFVFAAPNPWVIGRTNHYFITEAQKDEVSAAAQPPSFIAVFSTLLAIMILGLGAAMAFIWYRHSYHFNKFTWSDDFVLLAALMLSMMLALGIAFRSRTNRLRPLLANLPKSDVRITRGDVRRATLDMFSAKQLWLQAALSAFAAAMCLGFVVFKYLRNAVSGDPMSILFLIATCMVGWGLIASVRLAVEKTMQEQARR
jgi:hypothetical protein